MICEEINLGSFDRCEPVIIDLVEDQVTIENFETSWSCTFPDGIFGLLSRGHYSFLYNDQQYKFRVV